MKQGILLINTGSPASTGKSDVARYLRSFLSDPRVIDLPFVFRTLLVNAVIVPFRASRSASLYRKIWTEAGSPLAEITGRQSESLQQVLEKERPGYFVTDFAMRYGSPGIGEVLNKFYKKNIRNIIVVPLFPQNAAATSGSAVAEVYKESARLRIPPALTVIPPYYRHPAYIESLAVNAAEFLENSGRLAHLDYLLFSYHGLPERHIYKDSFNNHCKINDSCCNAEGADYGCYRAQCYETSRLTAEKLKKITQNKNKTWTDFWKRAGWGVSFQSRLGRDPWIGPFTDETLKQLAESARNPAVYAPAFAADCLETLHELTEEGHRIFTQAGGKHYVYIPALNEHPHWIRSLSQIILTFSP